MLKDTNMDLKINNGSENVIEPKQFRPRDLEYGNFFVRRPTFLKATQIHSCVPLSRSMQEVVTLMLFYSLRQKNLFIF